MIMCFPINLAQNLAAFLFLLGYTVTCIFSCDFLTNEYTAPTAHQKINSKQVNSSSEFYEESVIFPACSSTYIFYGIYKIEKGQKR